MKFKIDTNPNYTRILPEEVHLSATMAALLIQKCRELQRDQPQNLIVDLSLLPDVEAPEADAFFEGLTTLQEAQYEGEKSLVFTGIAPLLMAQLKRADLHHILNITPTFQEALDMVNMEILERDLFNEEP